MSEPQGNYKMRFICDKNGRLLKGAPGNYECGKVYMQPYRMSKFKFWELIEEPPELKIPAMSEEDSVYSDAEAVFIPPEEEDEEEEVPDTPDSPASVQAHQPINLPEDDELNIDPNTPATVEPYVKYNPVSDKITGVSDTTNDDVTLSTPEPEEPEELDEEELVAELTRDEIFKILDEAGVEYSKHTATEYLMNKVEELEDASTQE